MGPGRTCQPIHDEAFAPARGDLAAKKTGGSIVPSSTFGSERLKRSIPYHRTFDVR